LRRRRGTGKAAVTAALDSDGTASHFAGMSNELVLEGLRVLELAGVLAGPAAGMFLAELGADVIKVENPSTDGDVTRGWRLPQEPRDTGVSAYFCAANWGKRSIAVDLRDPEGRELIQSLARRSDIVLASYRPGQAEALDVDAESLMRLNDRLIYAEVTAYGRGDPRPGYDALLQAGTGFMSINGEPGALPLKMPVALMDLLAAHQLKEGILLALLARERMGSGTHVTTSLVRSGLSSLANQATGWLATGVVPAPLGSGHPSVVPYGEAWQCDAGEPVVLAVGTDRQFARLCAAVDAPEVASDPRFTLNADRVVHREALRAELAPRIASMSRDALLASLSAAGVPAGPVWNVAEALGGPDADPLLLRSGNRVGLRTVALDDGFETVVELRPPPDLSADAESILAVDLGLSAARRAELYARGAVVPPGGSRG
jgi:crotonobetainyl-CoA:carnitine CoA-transferase CaiB-like acyl-CoA transferase